LLATDEYDPAHGAPPKEAYILRLRDGQSGRELAACTHHEAALMRMAFSPDGKTLAAWGYGSTVRLWDVAEILTKAAVKAP
jgi:WD40 repeat protein